MSSENQPPRQPLYKVIPLQRRLILKKAAVPALGIAVVTELFSAVLLSSLARNTKVDPGISSWVIFLWTGTVAAAIASKFIWEYIYLRRYRYDIDRRNVIIRKGVVTKHEVTLPFSKITDVYVDRDVLDVVFNLWDLHISTPTALSGMTAHIDGLSKDGCRRIREMILDGIRENDIALARQSSSPNVTSPTVTTA